MRNLALALLLLLTAACVAHGLYYYPLLPDQVARHFDGSGRPDAWGSKSSFLAVYLSTVALLDAVFLGIAWMLPRLPDSRISLPQKELWLSPEHRRRTLDLWAAALLGFASLTLLFLLDVFHQSFRVHLGQANRLEHIGWSLGLYLFLTTAGCVALVLWSRRGPPREVARK